MTDNNNEEGPASAGSGFDLDKGFRLGDIEVLPRQSTVVRDGERISVEPRAMEVLVCLATRNGDTVTHREFEDEVWRDRVVGPENLQRAIFMVRQALGDTESERQFVRTIPTVGYRLITEVTPLVDPGSAVAPAWRGWTFAGAAVAAVTAVVLVLAPGDFMDDGLPLTTISVQCFDNLSNAPDSEYFAEGLADDEQ